jgi:hypothetical protein
MWVYQDAVAPLAGFVETGVTGPLREQISSLLIFY